MSEDVVERISKLCRDLYRANVVCFIFCALMFIVSIGYGVSNALKHGISWEVITVIDGVQSVTTHNTFLNLAMSSMFLFMGLVSMGSFGFLYMMYHPDKFKVVEA